MANKALLLLLAGSLTLAACSDDGGGGSDNGGGTDVGQDAGADAGDALRVTAVQPSAGDVAGGTEVTISGTGFAEGATVFFGSTEAASTTFVSQYQLQAVTPPADQPGWVQVQVQNPDGTARILSQGFEYTGEGGGNAVGWCTIQHPPTLTSAPGAQAAPVFGRVYVEGCTTGDQQCDTVTAELGWAPAGSDPTADPDAFSWSAATYNAGHTADDNDEYEAALTAPDATGDYVYAYRFSVEGQSSWTYCDLDGSDNGVSAAQLGQWSVVEEPPPAIGWCNLHHPAATTTAPGELTESLYGRVYVEGCTTGDQQCGDVLAQVGWGDRAVDPSASADQWTWNDAVYNDAHTADDNDEYWGAVAPPDEGTYAYAYRFSLDQGTTWSYCDLDSSDNGFDTAQTGELTVEPAAQSLPIGWCALQFPTATQGPLNTATERIYGRVFVETCSEADAECDQVTAELGWGDAATDPTADPTAWSWEPATYNPGHTADDNDEYWSEFTPPATGTYGYAYRFSTDGGTSWTYCDADGSDNGYDTAQAGELTVDTTTVDWCILQFPATTTVTSGSASDSIYGQVYSAGCTTAAAECPYLVGELGFGPETADPSADAAAFTWVRADYNSGHTSNDNDEFQASFTPASAGTYRYVYRFSGDGGQTWSYCDTDGSPFDAAQAGVATVQ